jgi:sugar phosphate isomerase/epimerase
MTRLEQAGYFRQKIKNHPHIKIAVNQFTMAQEESDWLAALREHLDHIGYIQLAEQNGCLPGQGMLDYGVLREALADYSGWLTLTSEQPVTLREIADSMVHLRACGF